MFAAFKVNGTPEMAKDTAMAPEATMYIITATAVNAGARRMPNLRQRVRP